MIACKNFSLEVLTECKQLAGARPYAGPQGVTCVFRDKRVRAVGCKWFCRPLGETHDDFIIWYLRHTLGDDWLKDQRRLPPKEQHKVMHWGLHAQAERERTLAGVPGSTQVVGVAPTGDVQSLLALAHDIYCLSLADQLPQKILNRVRGVREFQGARYEIALAASMVRAGFSISWLESNETHAEFTAFLAESGETIIVEAKSRRRPGVLHESGKRPDLSCLRADIERLYRRALAKPTQGLPYLIGIDVNLPLTADQAGDFPRWMKDVFALIDKGPVPTAQKPAKEFMLVLTNFAWHYSGEQPAPPHEVVYLPPEWAVAVPTDKRTIIATIQAFSKYGARPEGVF